MTSDSRNVTWRHRSILLVVLLIAAFFIGWLVRGDRSGLQDAVLAGWPESEREQIVEMIAACRGRSDHPYAVFDADNTIWQFDIEESLLPFLENRKLISLEKLDAALKPIPTLDGESMYSYYLRLDEIDVRVSYLWIAQAFSGFTLAQLKQQVDDLMSTTEPIPVTRWDANKSEFINDTVNPPRIFNRQRQLINTLSASGVDVYVMTASAEEIVRMVVSDPRYGINVKPERVIGVSFLLRDPESGAVTTARQRIANGPLFDDQHTPARHMAHELTSFPWTPLTWYIGKRAAIQTYIDPIRRPMLVAGDSTNDHWMLFYADAPRGGLRLWVDRKASGTEATHAAIKDWRKSVDGAALEHDPVAPERGWLWLKPERLHGDS